MSAIFPLKHVRKANWSRTLVLTIGILRIRIDNRRSRSFIVPRFARWSTCLGFFSTEAQNSKTKTLYRRCTFRASPSHFCTAFWMTYSYTFKRGYVTKSCVFLASYQTSKDEKRFIVSKESALRTMPGPVRLQPRQRFLTNNTIR